MKRKCILPFILFLLPVAQGCKKVIQVDLNSAASQIVIEGEVTDVQGFHGVTITKTVNFSASNSFPPVSGAMVTITDSNSAQNFTLAETTPGVYSSAFEFQGQAGHTYLLSVSAGGQTYAASSTMPQPVLLDSINFVDNLDFNNKTEISAVVNFQDPPGLGNDYRFVENVNGNAEPDIFVFEDRLSDGKYIRQALYNDTSTLHVGDNLVVNLYCIDKKIYDYFFSLSQVSGNNSFRSASPANPVSNISNGALGYFSAHTVSAKGLTVY